MIKKVLSFFKSRFYSPEKYARSLGATIGKNCIIKTRNWSSESYLVTVGNNCQMANGVTIHTHGGGQIVRTIDPNFDVFGKVSLRIGHTSEPMHRLCLVSPLEKALWSPQVVLSQNPCLRIQLLEAILPVISVRLKSTTNATRIITLKRRVSPSRTRKSISRPFRMTVSSRSLI